MPKLTKQERDEIDRHANVLYDRLNPEPDAKINVTKAECIRRVMAAKSK